MADSTLCVGGDIHQDELFLRATDKTDGHEVGQRLTVKNNRPGADQAIAHFVQRLTQHGYTHLEFGLEATGLFWLPFYVYLQQSPALAPFQPTWVCFNPKLVAKFKEGVTLSEIKDDDHDALAGVACARGVMERAARLFGAAEVTRAAMSETKPPFDFVEYERDQAALRASLGEQALAALWAEGKAMPLEQAIQYARGQLIY